MRTPSKLAAAVAVIALLPATLFAQAFSSGSNGSFGAIDTGSATVVLDVPPDGIFHCTTIRVGANGFLRFRRNALNTPVYLLATGDVTITGIIDLNGTRGSASTPGLGGAGGFDGGSPGSVGLPAGDGHGPGGGKAGIGIDGVAEAGGGSYAAGSEASPPGQRGATYGNPLLIPMVGGSGGGGVAGATGFGGGGGGGAILIASDTQITQTGSVNAYGGGGFSGAILNTGSGGAIRLVAPRISGNGVIRALADGGVANRGDGRIRIDTVDRSAFALSLFPAAYSSVGGLMVVFPNPLPRLDIVQVAGRDIPLDTPSQVLLPVGSPAAQIVRVRARDFGQSVPIRVVLTPDSGPSSTVDAQIDNAGTNPAETTVNVSIPANVLTRVAVYTR